MAEYLIQGDTLSEIAAAIREKTGKTTNIKVSNMASEIASIANGSNVIVDTFVVSSASNTAMIPCHFMPSTLVMFGGNNNTDMGAFLIIHDADLVLRWDRHSTHVFAQDLTNNSIYKAHCSFNPEAPEGTFFWMKQSGTQLIVCTGSSINFSEGGWTFIAVE